MNIVKTIYLEMPGVFHSYYNSFIADPPTGYRFISNNRYDAYFPKGGKRLSLMQNRLLPSLNTLPIPIKIIRSIINSRNKPQVEVALTLTQGLIDFRREPWITVVEDALSSFLGLSIDVPLYHKMVERALARDNCKGIVYFLEAARNSLTCTYNIERFSSKMRFVPLAIPLVKKQEKTRNSDTINLITFGSTNFFTPAWFYVKGCHIAIKAFLRLQKEFSNITFTVIGNVPSEFSPLRNHERIVILDNPLSHDEFNKYLWNMDICLLPSLTTPWTGFLDAMNHELPVVTTETHGNREMIHHGKWGFVCPVPEKMNCIVNNFSIGNRSEYKKINGIWLRDNEAIVQEITEATRNLIRDEVLRKNMGKMARQTIEPSGMFSIERRNAILKNVLDAATQS